MAPTIRGHEIDDLPERSAYLVWGYTICMYYLALSVAPFSALFALELYTLSALGGIVIFMNAVPGSIEEFVERNRAKQE